VFFAVCTKDERRSIFNRDTLADKPLRVAAGLSLAVIVLETSLSPLQRLLQTTDLELQQWLVCIGVALVVPIVSELRKLLVRRPIDEAPDAALESIEA
jgi:Ca2+-transporting ATPase